MSHLIVEIIGHNDVPNQEKSLCNTHDRLLITSYPCCFNKQSESSTHQTIINVPTVHHVISHELKRKYYFFYFILNYFPGKYLTYNFMFLLRISSNGPNNRLKDCRSKVKHKQFVYKIKPIYIP